MTEQEISQLATAVAKEMAAYESPVLTKDEAAVLAKCKSEHAFDRWRRKWSVEPCDDGRYPRHRVLRGLEREAKHRHRSKRGAHFKKGGAA